MDGKIYYQVILIDTEEGTYRAATGAGGPARKFKTLWAAEEDRANWANAIPDKPHLHLGVQEVRSTPMPGHKPVNDYKQGE